MKKIIITSGLILACGLAQAASNTSNIKVSAKTISGCNIQGKNFNIGNIFANSTNSSPRVTENITLRCSKGTAVRLEAHSQVNPEGFRGFYLTKGAKQVIQNGNVDKPADVGLKYYLGTSGVSSVPGNVSVTFKNTILAKNLIPASGRTYDYGMELTVLSENPVVLPIDAFLFNNNYMLFPAGDYSDVVTLNLTY